MKNFALFMILLAPALAQQQDRHGWPVEDRQNIQRTFELGAGAPSGPGGAPKLLVDNVNGAIHVTGYDGNQVKVNVEEHFYARSQDALAEAKRDVKLDTSQQGNFVRLYADGPFRCHDGGCHGSDYNGYEVDFNYDIQVPAGMELELKTINHGAIEVRKTTGDYDIHGLNGGIDMEEVSGSGTVHTLNGPVKVTFSRNPAKDTQFHTLNGKIDVYFQPGVNADFSFHHLNGGIYSDFEIGPQPAPGAAGNGNGKFVYRSSRGEMKGRAGTGGPLLSFHTLNGSILLHSKGI